VKAARIVRPGGRWKRTHTGHLASGLPELVHSDSRKAGGTFTVRAEVHPDDYIWVEVEDNGGPWNDHGHHDGRPHGLDIVRALTTESGLDGDPITGWVAWARIDLRSAEDA
jgi:hypothetical protein